MPKLSDGELYALAAHHFGDLGGEHVAIAVAVCKAESGGVVEAVNDNYPRWQPDPNSIYRWDYGLMQVNSVHGYDADRLISDGDYNFWCARQIWNLQGWNAWTTYRWGHYLAYYQEPAAPAPEPAPEPTPPPQQLPPILTLDAVYLKVTDAFIPAYDSTRNTRFLPARYDQDGDRRYGVYELWVEE